MKKILVLLSLLACTILAQEKQNLLNHPHVSIVGIESETEYVHPSQLLNWLEKRKPTNIRFGQMGCCIINGKTFAVSAPHVIQTPDWPHPLKTNSHIGTWVDSADGREISFAEIKDASALGFTTKPIEGASVTHEQIGSIQSTWFNPKTMTVDEFTMTGIVEILSDAEHLKTIANFFKTVNPEGAITKRLNTRAPEKSILVMQVDPKFRSFVQGASGSLLYQNGKPVGVFVAALFLEDTTTLLLAEPIMEAGKVTLKK